MQTTSLSPGAGGKLKKKKGIVSPDSSASQGVTSAGCADPQGWDAVLSPAYLSLLPQP